MLHPRSCTLAAVIAAAVTASCGSRAQCKVDAKQLADQLAAAEHAGALEIDAHLQLVLRPDLARGPIVRAPTVEVFADGLAVAGKRVGLDELAASLHAGPDAHRVILAIDGAAPWSEVVAVAQAVADAGFDRPAWAFAAPPPARPFPRGAIDDQLDRAAGGGGAADVAVTIADALSKSIESCPAFVRAFSELASADGGNKADTLIAAIEPALADCGCSVDLPAVRAVLWRALVPDRPTRTLDTTLAHDGTVLAIPAATPWRDACRQLTAGARVSLTAT